jgi:hypothetical protein
MPHSRSLTDDNVKQQGLKVRARPGYHLAGLRRVERRGTLFPGKLEADALRGVIVFRYREERT